MVTTQIEPKKTLPSSVGYPLTPWIFSYQVLSCFKISSLGLLNVFSEPCYWPSACNDLNSRVCSTCAGKVCRIADVDVDYSRGTLGYFQLSLSLCTKSSCSMAKWSTELWKKIEIPGCMMYTLYLSLSLLWFSYIQTLGTLHCRSKLCSVSHSRMPLGYEDTQFCETFGNCIGSMDSLAWIV